MTDGGKKRADAAPEGPPEFSRKIVLARWQLVGVVVLLAIPLLALAGVLGDGRRVENARDGQLTVEVESPRCARYGNPVWISVRLGAESPANVARPAEVSVSAGYLARFSDIKACPPATAHTAEAMICRQEPPERGGVAPVRLELMPERYGWARGRVRASLPTGEVVELPLKTFIFP